MRKKLLSALLCTAMVSTLLTGCGDDGSTSTSTGTGTGNDSETGSTRDTSSSTPSASGGKVYYLNFKPEQAEDWEALAKAYTDETGVEVKVVTAASNTYEQTLKSEMAKSDAPTMFQVNGPVGLATWNDYCYDLKDSDVYSQVKSDDFVLKDGDAVKGIAYVIETYGIIYNKSLLQKYCEMDGAKIKDVSEINGFAKLKEVADDIQAKKADLGVDGAFTSAGMDSSSDWRFKTHLANLPIYYEYQADGIGSTEAIKGTYLDQYKQMWDLYITDATCDAKLLGSKTGDEASAEFSTGKAVFYQNGTWEYDNISANLADEDLGMLPIYIGAEGEENQGLCTGSENYWCVNSKASEADIQATLDFMNWCITSDTGRDSIANTMGFVTPFKSFDDGYTASNPLIQASNEYIDAGKTAVSWNFSTIPSEEWKNEVGNALLEYAQGTGEWDAVKTAFVDGWAEQYQATH
ncbi:MAG: ABC transporter substrate-binding protein [Lachnospiraceae bacterium]|nr:ABC transporter substrate-binding protein [Lachnospiraceae bacterium]